MNAKIRKTSRFLLAGAFVVSVCGISDGAPKNKKQVAVIDLGEPGITYAYFQETEALSPGTLMSVPWLGGQSEDAFLVVDTAVLKENGWSLEDSKTAARISGHVLFQTHIAVRNPSEKRRTYTALVGMLQAFDSNNDKRIDSSDFLYRALGLYRDKNGDGKIDPEEISSLESEGIAEIGIVMYGGAKRDAQGSSYRVIRVKKTDGATIEAHVVTLNSR
jgi:hypothetical protein